MPPSVLQDVLTEGDTGSPFFSDRDGSEEPRPATEIIPLDLCLKLLVSRADALGHRTVSVDELRELLG